jgi:hypothetical protein
MQNKAQAAKLKGKPAPILQLEIKILYEKLNFHPCIGRPLCIFVRVFSEDWKKFDCRENLQTSWEKISGKL